MESCSEESSCSGESSCSEESSAIAIECSYVLTCNLTASKIEHMIKWSLLELFSNTSIKYEACYKINEYKNDKNPLKLSIAANNYSFDVGICELSKLIESNQELIVLKDKLIELHSKDGHDEIDADEIYEVETDLFHKFVELAGLDELQFLDWSSFCYFKDELFDSIYE